MSLSDYTNCCRICLKPNGDCTTDVYSYRIAGRQQPLVEVVFALFNIKLHTHPDFPVFMCRRCSVEMENVLLIKDDMERNQNHLIQLFENSNINRTCITQINSDYSGVLETSQVDVSDCTYIKSEPESESISNIHIKSELVAQDMSSIKSSRKALRCMSHVRRSARNISRSASTSSRGSVYLQNDIKKEDVLQVKKEEVLLSYQSLDAESPLGAIPPAEGEIPQASFLQNFNLITLQDAEILRNQEPVSRPRQRFVPKKFADFSPSRASKSKDENLPKSPQKRPGYSKKTSFNTNGGSECSVLSRSINFLNRYGCRKLDNTQLKRGKILMKSDGFDATLNRVKSALNKAVPKATGCENTSYLFNVKNKVQIGEASSYGRKTTNNPKILLWAHNVPLDSASKCLNPVKRSRGRPKTTFSLAMEDKKIKEEIVDRFASPSSQTGLLDTTNFYSQNNNQIICNKNFHSEDGNLINVKSEFPGRIQCVDVSEGRELQLSFPQGSRGTRSKVKRLGGSPRRLKLDSLRDSSGRKQKIGGFKKNR